MKFKYKLLTICSTPFIVLSSCAAIISCSNSQDQNNKWMDPSIRLTQPYLVKVEFEDISQGMDEVRADDLYWSSASINFNILKNDFLITCNDEYNRKRIMNSVYIQPKDVTRAGLDATKPYSYNVGFKLKGTYMANNYDLTIEGEVKNARHKMTFNKAETTDLKDSNWITNIVTKDMLDDHFIAIGKATGKYNDEILDNTYQFTKNEFEPEMGTPAHLVWEYILKPLKMKAYSLWHVKKHLGE